MHSVHHFVSTHDPRGQSHANSTWTLTSYVNLICFLHCCCCFASSRENLSDIMFCFFSFYLKRNHQAHLIVLLLSDKTMYKCEFSAEQSSITVMTLRVSIIFNQNHFTLDKFEQECVRSSYKVRIRVLTLWQKLLMRLTEALSIVSAHRVVLKLDLMLQSINLIINITTKYKRYISLTTEAF